MEKQKEKIDAKVKRVSKEVQDEIKAEVFLNVPNMITLVRVVFVFIFVFMLFNNYPKLSLLIVFGIAAVSDWFDGYFARRLNQTTRTGARLDQVIDRVFTTIVFVSLLLYYFMNPNEHHPMLLLFLAISREIIGTPGFLIALIRNKDAYKVKYIGKVTTFIQGFAFGAIILEVSWAVYIVLPTCIIGIISGIDYLRYSLE